MMVLVAVSGASFAAGKDVTAVIATMRGKLEVRAANSKSWSSGKPGQFLYEGDTVRTGRGSRAVISFVNGIETRMNSNSTFSVGTQDISAKGQGTAITMAIGKVWTKILRPKTKFAIHTPVAVCSVRGTEYETGVDENGRTEVKVFSGDVEVSNEYGSTHVTKDTKNTTEPGSAPSAPAPMTSEEKPTWQEELKNTGTMKIELAKDAVLVNEVVDAVLSVYDSAGTKNVKYKDKIDLSSDNSALAFSDATKEKWSAALRQAPVDGELKFRVKFTAAGAANVSAAGETLGVAMARLEAKLPQSKSLKLKVRTADGKDKELLLRFKAK